MTKGLRSTRQDHGLIQFLTGGKNNRELRLWSVAPHGNVAASPAPHQTLILPHKPESSHESLLLLIFPRGEFIAASDPTQDLLYVAHLNYSSDNNVSGLAKIDYLRLVYPHHLYAAFPYFHLESQNYQKAFFW